MCAVSQWASLRFKDDDPLGVATGTSTATTMNDARVLTQDILVRLEAIDKEANNATASTQQQQEEEEQQQQQQQQPRSTLVLDRQVELCSMSSAEFEQHLSRKEKRKLGRACKECLDVARVCGILQYGYQECHMFRYTTNSTEDLLVVAK